LKKYEVDLDQTQKEYLFELAERKAGGYQEFLDSISMGESTLSYQRNNSDARLSLEKCNRLLTMLNESSPRFRMDSEEVENPEMEYVEGRNNYGGTENFELEENFQKFLFNTFDNPEITEKLDVSSTTATKYLEGESSIETESYRQIFSEVREIMNSTVDITADIHRNENLTVDFTDNLVMENVGSDDIIQFKKAISHLNSYKRQPDHLTPQQKTRRSRIYSGIVEDPEPIRDILEKVQNNEEGINMGKHGTESGVGLRELGVIERFGDGNSTYHFIEEDSEGYIAGLLAEAETVDLEDLKHI
jgi:hypothetical protein